MSTALQKIRRLALLALAAGPSFWGTTPAFVGQPLPAFNDSALAKELGLKEALRQSDYVVLTGKNGELVVLRLRREVVTAASLTLPVGPSSKASDRNALFVRFLLQAARLPEGAPEAQSLASRLSAGEAAFDLGDGRRVTVRTQVSAGVTRQTVEIVAKP